MEKPTYTHKQIQPHNDIANALKALGVAAGTFSYKPISDHPLENHYKVYLNGADFGIWDSLRKTFVD